ncbi:MAG: chaperone modulator CbpM [Mariniphaga sp.]
MQTDSLISLNEFCASHEIEISFICSLQETGLIEITSMEETACIEASQLQQLERLVRLHYELDINMEGIETITYLLQRIGTLQAEITRLKNRLRIFEPEE